MCFRNLLILFYIQSTLGKSVTFNVTGKDMNTIRSFILINVIDIFLRKQMQKKSSFSKMDMSLGLDQVI